MQNHLLFIEANTTGTGMLALHKAQMAGLSPVFLTNSPSRYPGLAAIRCPVFTCDTNSTTAVLQAIQMYLPTASIAGITTTSEFYIEIVAQLAMHLKLPGAPYDAICICRNKALTRLTLQAAGIQQPHFLIIRSRDELEVAFDTLDPPYIVKPVDDTSSFAVKLCYNSDEGKEHAQTILALTHNIRGQRAAQTVLLEEFLAAPEFSVEMFSWNAVTTCIGITEKHVTGLPYFVEQRHIFPALLPDHVAQTIESTVRQALTAVGITHGPTHTEIKWTSRGCAIIEINARLAGGMIPELIRSATTLDLLQQQLAISVGKAPDLSFTRADQEYAGIQFLLASEEGLLERVCGIEQAQKRRGVHTIELTAFPGNMVHLPRSSYDRLGFVIVGAPSYKEVVHLLQEVLAQLEIQVISDPTQITKGKPQ